MKTVKIDFSPNLFDEIILTRDDPDPSLVETPGKSSKVILGLVVTFTMLMAAVFAVRWPWITDKPVPSFSSLSKPVPAGSVAGDSVLTPLDNNISLRTSQVTLDNFCNGYEVICAITSTDKPADMLRKLITALPQGAAKHYQVRLSVTPADD